MTDYLAAPMVETVASYTWGMRRSRTAAEECPAFVVSDRDRARVSGELFARKIRKLIGASVRAIAEYDRSGRVRAGGGAGAGAEMVVFDNSDDLPRWNRRRAGAPSADCTDAAAGDKTLCVNEHVSRRSNIPQLLFRNCTTFDSLQKTIADFSLPPWFPKAAGRTYVGFIAACTRTRGYGLLEHLLRRSRNTRFYSSVVSEGPA